MIELTRMEASFLLDLLREMKTPDEDSPLFDEELDQAIEILEALIERI